VQVIPVQDLWRLFDRAGETENTVWRWWNY